MEQIVSGCLLRQKIQPFERLLRCLQRVRMRRGAGAAPDVRAERAGREAGLLELGEAVGRGLLLRLLLSLCHIHIIGATGAG